MHLSKFHAARAKKLKGSRYKIYPSGNGRFLSISGRVEGCMIAPGNTLKKEYQ